MQNRINHLLNEIYDAYKGKVKEASEMWKSEYCYLQEEEDKRDIEDKEDLKYFKGLLQRVEEIINAK